MLALTFNNDPTPLGWLTFAAYFVAAIFCARRASKSTPGSSHPSCPRTFWALLTLTLLLLGINKQADLQTSFVDLAKRLAEVQGWYPHRRLMQILVISLCSLAAAVYLALLVRLVRPSFRSHLLAIAGIFILFLFLFLRAVDVDRLFSEPDLTPSHVTRLWPMEFLGIILIASAALRPVRDPTLATPRKTA